MRREQPEVSTGACDTRTSLLVRLGDSLDSVAWREFLDFYTPLIYRHARKSGFQDADAADISQEVLCAIAHAIRDRQYDRRKGSFRGWLFTIVRNTQHNWRVRQARRPALTGQQDIIDGWEDKEQDLQALWNAEHEKHLLAWAAGRVHASVKEATWQAFWRTAVKGMSFQQVAAELGMSVGSVYAAKSRVLVRLRQEVRRFQEL
jgi:RNA polymerase sigma factor (sigma-70 family)